MYLISRLLLSLQGQSDKQQKLIKMTALKFEKRNKAVAAMKGTIEYIAKTSKTKYEAVNRLSDILPRELKVGNGGSHVWCSNQANERIFIIEF